MTSSDHKGKKIVHIAKHVPTGAKVPVLVGKMDKNNVITDYREDLLNRKGFTLEMLKNRWDKCVEDVVALLAKYQVPAHVDHQDISKLLPDQKPIDAAIFFEEYIYALEKKANLSHNKLKSRTLEKIKTH